MRLTLEILSLLLLACLGLSTPYRDYAHKYFPDLVAPSAASAQQTSAPTAAPEPTPPLQHARIAAPRPVATPRDSSWMWEPTKLDHPYNRSRR